VAEDMRKALVDKGQAPHAAIVGCPLVATEKQPGKLEGTHDIMTCVQNHLWSLYTGWLIGILLMTVINV